MLKSKNADTQSCAKKKANFCWFFLGAFYCFILHFLGLVIRIIYLLKVKPEFGNDDERYIFIARSLFALDFQNAIHYHYPPFAPFLVMLVNFFTNNFETALRLVAITANTLTIIPLYFLALHIFGRRTAILSAGFFACRFFNYSPSDLAEQVEILFLYLALLSGLLALQDKKSSKFFLTGILFGIAFLTKPEAWAFFLLFASLSLLSSFWLKEKQTSPKSSFLKFIFQRFGKMIFALLILGAGYFLIAGFYLFCYYQDTGKFSFNPKAHTLFIHHNLYHPLGLQYYIQEDESGVYTLMQRIMEGDKIPLEQTIPEILWQNRKQFPSIYLMRFKSNFYRFICLLYLQSIATWVWLILLPLGLFPQFSRERLRLEFYLHSFGLLPLLLVPFFSSGFPRFFFSMVPWFMIMLGRGTDRLLGLVGLSKKALKLKKFYLSPDLLFALLLLIISAMVQLIRSQPNPAYWNEIAYRKEIGERLKAILPEGCRFMAELENQSLWYLAGFPPSRQVILPFDPLPALPWYAEKTNAKYLVFHPSSFPDRYTPLNVILEPDFSFPGMKLTFRGKSPAGKIYVIYEFENVKCATKDR